MDGAERLRTYIHDDFDVIIMNIKNGTIKCGRYAPKVKLRDIKLGKELFADGRDDSGKRRQRSEVP